MGRKGVSKRKSKKSESVSKDNNHGSSNRRPGESPSVGSLSKDKDAPHNRGVTNPSAGSNKKDRKGK